VNFAESSVKEIIKEYSLLGNRQLAKSFGQNFLIDENILAKIVKVVGRISATQQLIEIGPGSCSLSKHLVSLLPDSDFLLCIEKDKRLQQLHSDFTLWSNGKIKVIYQDATEYDFSECSAKQMIIVSNLPYNVGVLILVNLLLALPKIDKMTLMFQKEVAQRICAKKGTKAYGRISVLAQLLCETKILFDVSCTCFYPVPKVTSSIVQLTPIKQSKLPKNQIEWLEQIVALCFQHRRKTIFSILKKEFDQSLVKKVLNVCDIQQQDRPEDICPKSFSTLAELLYISK
jgi:16S rRNA (adenine1518-N6/adenine1519-N6)-dimethyltransferase